MKPLILVQVWCEIDPALNVRIDRGTGMPLAEGGDVLMRISPLGRCGVDAALGLGGFEVVAFAVGGGHGAALRHALASGAARAVHLGDGELAAWMEAQDPALVIADRSAGLLAGRLGWAHLAGLEEVRVEGGRLYAIRHLGRGDRERVSSALPAVIRLSGEAVRPRYVSRDRVGVAMGREIERMSFEEGAGEEAEMGPLQPARPRTRMAQAASQAPVSGTDRMKALMGMGQAPTPAAGPSESAPQTPDEMAEVFVRYLRHCGLMERGETSPTPLPPPSPAGEGGGE